MVKYKLSVDFTHGASFYCAWSFNSRADGMAMAKRQLDLLTDVKEINFSADGATDMKAAKELKAYVQAKKG